MLPTILLVVALVLFVLAGFKVQPDRTLPFGLAAIAGAMLLPLI